MQRPAFHFPETLTTELRLTTQWLLRDKAVRSDRTGVDLVINKVMQFQHIDDADCDLAVELVARAPIEQVGLTRTIKPGKLKHGCYVGFTCAVEHRCAHGNASGDIAGKLNNVGIAAVLDLVRIFRAIGFRQTFTHHCWRGCCFGVRVCMAPLFQSLTNLHPQTTCGPTKMGFENLTHVHT